ncbi:MAG TPA: homoserine O-succinyltransferase [Rhizomicrobium sp.]|jgi:homoserine O-succinyltransferase|nr:homoserine O-succinyltransferase [Rhizomicrobium sp.]
MAVVAAPTASRAGRRRASASEFCIELGLLNNMPDGALERTETQFFNLLHAAAPDLLVRVSFFSLSGISRGEAGLDHLRRNAYRKAAELAHAGLDALIITGTEPRLPDLRLEPYWTELTGLFDWLAQEGPSAVFSCLAAHAAVLHFDGIERRRLTEKRFGTFEHVIAGHDAFTEHLPEPLRVAHSRWNEVSESALASRGYRILTWARHAGVDLFVKRGRTDLLFCQGHPEYDPATLGREYHRDVRRYLARESETYPALPTDYFQPGEAVLLTRFRERAASGRCESLMAEYPAPRRRPDAKWKPPAAPVFRAWLRQIVECKRHRRLRHREQPVQPLALAKAS